MATAPDVRRSRDSDLRLVSAIVAGDLEAWHEFVRRHSAILYHTLRKHLVAEDEDEVRTLYVDVLYDLFHDKLATFEGRASLSTWLVLVARNAAFDRLRHLYGRPRESAAWKRLSPLEREVHRLWVVEGLSFEWVRKLARPDGPPLDDQELLDSIERIREVRGSDRRHGRRSRGISGAPSLPRKEYLDHLLELHAELDESRSPEAEAARHELGRTIDWLKSRIGELPDADRELLRLRFAEGLTAQLIAKRLGASSPRSIFTWVARLLRQIRSDLERHSP